MKYSIGLELNNKQDDGSRITKDTWKFQVRYTHAADINL